MAKILKETKPGEFENYETKIKYFGEIQLLGVTGNFFERTDVHEDGIVTKYYGIEIDDEDNFYSVVQENHSHTWERIGEYIYECECGIRLGLHAILEENENLKADLKEIAKRIKTLEPFDIY